ncbi:twin-arginine translocase TatA/TatE family subunit [Myxococcota bacterium]|jgi:Tat protein translocase TatB subunit|nr:twin-arginine translocase TatA/TatE family subunit [Myxococcota bacterium]
MFPSGIGFGELVVIGIVLLLVVGPKKLPDVAKDVGKGLKTIRKVSSQLRDSAEVDEIKRAVYGEPGHTPAWKRPVSEHLSELLEGDADTLDRYKANAAPGAPPPFATSHPGETPAIAAGPGPTVPPSADDDHDPDDGAAGAHPIARAHGPAAAVARAEATVRAEAAAQADAPAATPEPARDDTSKSA